MLEEPRPSVLVTRSNFSESAINLLRKHFNVDIWDNQKKGRLQNDDLVEQIKGKYAIFCTPENRIDQSVLEAAAPTLKVVSTVSVGVDHIDLGALKKYGIRLGKMSGVSTDAVAELTIALLLAASRRFREAEDILRTGKHFNVLEFGKKCRGLRNSTIGIVGYGRIGHAVAIRLKSFSVNQILYTSRSKKEVAAETGAIFTDIDTLMRTSDFVIVTIALTPETKGIISRERIALMKPTAIFVNTGRGDLVDQEALVEALQQKTILGAGLDVTIPEPLPLDHPLQRLDNCFVLPHIASLTNTVLEETYRLTAENIIAVMEGKPMPSEFK